MHPAFYASANAVLFPCFARIVQLVYCRLIRAQGFLFLLVLRYLHEEVGKLLARVEPVLVAAQLKVNVRRRCRGFVIKALELVAAEGHIHIGVVVFALYNVTVIAQHLTHGIHNISAACARIGYLRQYLAVAFAGAHNHVYGIGKCPVIPRFGGVAHTALRIVIQYYIVACGV